ncbi:hypothetical protein RRG08_051836 [Elysia crispata]|uniref:Uncharacterized protein n=1 Tax=Elysia crispata TaxID=231223 RepID=A0AAE1DCC3_9GAST|nr:hypothetical protein RRG08_051836 [Elysia crispata]
MNSYADITLISATRWRHPSPIYSKLLVEWRGIDFPSTDQKKTTPTKAQTGSKHGVRSPTVSLEISVTLTFTAVKLLSSVIDNFGLKLPNARVSEGSTAELMEPERDLLFQISPESHLEAIKSERHGYCFSIAKRKLFQRSKVGTDV